jgi:hypothetical protein
MASTFCFTPGTGKLIERDRICVFATTTELLLVYGGNAAIAICRFDT